MRNLTKASRDASRTAQFESLLNNGYIQETYKGLEIFKDSTNLLLKVFIGNAANHSIFYKYRTLQQLEDKIQNVKDSFDMREQWKAEQKEKNKGYKSSHAAASAAIKAELKKIFPNTKFSVKSDSFSGGNSVNVSWENGQTEEQVNKVISKYQYGHFNGMEDIYENTNSRDDIPQAKYVSGSRTISESLLQTVKQELMKVKTYSEADAYKILINTPVPNFFESVCIAYDTKEHEYKLIFETNEQATPKEEQQKATQPTPSGKIQVVDYSEKAIAVIGEISEHYDNLINLGGSYNSRLKCGKGIIFSKKRLEDVKAYFLAQKEQSNTNTHEEQETQVEQIEPMPILESNNYFDLETFKIIWHEGRHIEGATFENKTFFCWDDVQKAFYILWQVNEKGQGGVYTKVKCEIKLQNREPEICRIDITDKEANGDFNPSAQHITEYLVDLFEDENETAQQITELFN